MPFCCSDTIHPANAKKSHTSEELELVAAARTGSSAAFEELQNRYGGRLFRRIHSITRNHEDAEDALQDTFLRAYLALGRFEGRSKFGTWLTRIAINSALMVVRRRRTRAEISLQPATESGEPAPAIDVPDTALNPEQLYDLRQRYDHVSNAINKLGTNLRPPVRMWIEQECPVKDLARTLGLSLGTVKGRLHRARKQLTGAAALKGRASNAGPISPSKGSYMIADAQNRELLCQRCD